MANQFWTVVLAAGAGRRLSAVTGGVPKQFWRGLDGRFLAAAYTTLPKIDFSRDVLSLAPRLSTYVWPSALGWSDLGTPVRLREWQARTTVVAAPHPH